MGLREWIAEQVREVLASDEGRAKIKELLQSESGKQLAKEALENDAVRSAATDLVTSDLARDIARDVARDLVAGAKDRVEREARAVADQLLEPLRAAERRRAGEHMARAVSERAAAAERALDEELAALKRKL
jgi:hypothetical protein